MTILHNRWTYEFCHGEQVRQYHANNLIDATTGSTKQKIETEHILGMYEGSGNSVDDYPNEDEHKHVVNATGVGSSADLGAGLRKGAAAGSSSRAQNSGSKNEPGGNGAVYIQEYKHGEVATTRMWPSRLSREGTSFTAAWSERRVSGSRAGRSGS